jgi:hypothetical protein
MALWIEPGVTTCEIDGVTFRIRILPSRDQGRVAFLTAGMARREIGEEDANAEYRILEIGLDGWSGGDSPPDKDDKGRLALERLPVAFWDPLVMEIVKANGLTDTDRGNSHAS